MSYTIYDMDRQKNIPPTVCSDCSSTYTDGWFVISLNKELPGPRFRFSQLCYSCGALRRLAE